MITLRPGAERGLAELVAATVFRSPIITTPIKWAWAISG